MFGRPSSDAGALGLGADDLAELTALGREVAAEYPVASPAVIAATAGRVLQRQVPLNALGRQEPGPSYHLRFADGTAFVVEAEHSGDLGWAAVQTVLHKLVLVGYRRQDDGVWLQLSNGHRVLRLLAIGIDR